jgi:hypothetical protein
MASRGRGGDVEASGRGRGYYTDWRAHPERKDTGASDDKDLEDTASSPVNSGDVIMNDADKLAKRRLGFAENETGNPGTIVLTNSAMLVDGAEVTAEVETGTVGVNTKKKHRKNDGSSVSTDSGSAASLEGVRREQ